VEASKLFAAMLQAGLRPSAVTFNSLVHMFARAGLCNDAESCWGRLQAEGVRPNAVTFNILIKMHSGRPGTPGTPSGPSGTVQSCTVLYSIAHRRHAGIPGNSSGPSGTV